jgi:hypothetical protein
LREKGSFKLQFFLQKSRGMRVKMDVVDSLDAYLTY